MPSAPRRKRTARADLPSRCAILPTGSYPAQFNKRSSSSAVQGRERGREACRGCSESCSTFSGEHDGSPAIAVLLRSCRMRRQQSPRFHSGTNCKTLLIASCFPAGPSFNPVLRTRSITGRNRGLIFPGCSFLPDSRAWQQPHCGLEWIVRRRHRSTRSWSCAKYLERRKSDWSYIRKEAEKAENLNHVSENLENL